LVTKYIHTEKLIIRNSVLSEKMTVAQLFKKFPTFYGTRTYNTVLATALHWTLH